MFELTFPFDATQHQHLWPRYTADEITPPANPEQSGPDLSPASRKLLDGFAYVPAFYKNQLSPPPGIVGDFAEHTAWATHRPFLKFAIPATLAVLSGIIGRGYKIGSKLGNGTALNVVLAAVSGTGKSDVISAWDRFCFEASKKIAPKPPQRVHTQQTASIQAIMADFSETPAGIWGVEEGESTFAAITDPSTPTEKQLSEAVRKLWDAGSHNKTFSPPKSIRGIKTDERPIPNISMSVFFAMPENRFEISDSNALDGVASRMMIVRHKGSSARLSEDPPRQSLPPHLHDRLSDLLGRAKALDDLYNMGALDEAFERLTVINFSQVSGLLKSITNEIEPIVTKAQDEGTAYVALTRVTDWTKRIAGTLAVVQNPNLPIVTAEELQWSFGYVLQNFANILSDFDSGEIGDKASDEEQAIKRAIKEMLKTDKAWKKIGGVPKKQLRDKLKHRAPFRRMKEVGKVITSTLDAMRSNGDLRVIHDLEIGQAEYWAIHE